MNYISFHSLSNYDILKLISLCCGVMTLNKADIRQMIISKLRKITDKERYIIENALLKGLVESNLWKKANSIGITISHGFEWDTSDLIKTAWKQGKQVYAPKCLPSEREMVFYRIENFNQLEVVYYNLLEPKPQETKPVEKNSIDLIVVPGVVFDKAGYRIGFGGGYYDRFLADYQNETVSLLHTEQLVDCIPIDSHDIAVNHLLTEKGLVK